MKTNTHALGEFPHDAHHPAFTLDERTSLVWHVVLQILFVLLALLAAASQGATRSWSSDLSPAAVVASSDGKTLFVGCATGHRVLVFDLATAKVAREIAVPAPPLALVLSADGSKLFAACAAPESTIAVIDVRRAKVTDKFPAGHTASALTLSPDGQTLYVCNRFNNEVAFVEIGTGKTLQRVRVPREPIAAALSLDGKLLFVANHIHAGRADFEVVASSLSAIDTATGRVAREIALPNGSGLLRGMAVSPDGKHVAVVHQISRFHLPTTQIERGWINNSALSLIDVATLKPINTVLLDNIDSGAANPWALAWTADGRRIVTTHAGTHELSVIDAPALLAKLAGLSDKLPPGAKMDYTIASHVAADVPNDLSFLVGIRTRIKLPEADRGPRALALIGDRAYVANYFSDTITAIDLASEANGIVSVSIAPAGATRPSGPEVQRVSLQLNSLAESRTESRREASPWPGLTAELARRMSPERKGEFYFNDASICFQGWQSCSSCHSHDARVDGFNWDNLNDGIGNPKNAKSLLFAHFTPPSMWLSVREDAGVAVRAGIRNSLFTVQPPEVAQSIDAYLKSLRPMPSPHLIKGQLSAAAERGRKLFTNEAAGCAECHRGKYFTDQKQHDVGTRSQYDKATDLFDTPALVEVWRSAPYLHDGSAATIRDVLTTRNPRNEHGSVGKLTPQQIDDLVVFVLSL